MKNLWRSSGAGAALIILLTVVVYLPALNAGFVFDDEQNVTSNQSLRTIEGLKRIWIEPTASPQYYPLTYTGFWVEYHLWGLHSSGYHAVNVLLHGLNTWLLGLFLARLAVPGAWLAALLFALHPVHVESVAWISELKNVLSGSFYLGALLTYLSFVGDTKRRWRFYALSFALFLCALLSKSSAVSMPFAMLLTLWWRQKRIKTQDVLTLIPFLVAGAALGLLTAWVEVRYSGAHGPEWQMSLLERCLVAGRVIWFYAGKLLWPHPLMIVYPRWQIDAGVWWQYVFPCGVGAVILALWRFRKRLGKGPFVAVVFFAGTLAPIPAFINVAFMGYSYVADHWQYLSSIGLIALAVAAAERIYWRTGEQHRHFAAVAGMAVVMVLAATTWKRSCVYADNDTLWRDNVAKNPNAWLAHYNLGTALGRAGRIREAIGHFEQALRIKPDDPDAHYNLGNALSHEGRFEDAMEQWEQALRIKPDFAEAHYKLGETFARLGKMPEAIRHFELALRIKPDFAEAHYGLGSALAGVGRVPEAMEHWEQVLRLRPDFAEAHYDLGVALVGLGRVPEAIGHWEQAVRLKPDYTEAHYNLGFAFEQEGRIQEAIEHYEQALRSRPDYTEAQNKLARLRALQ